MLKTQKVFWWRTGFANTEGKLGKEPDGEMGSIRIRLKHNFLLQISPGIEECPCLPHHIAIAQWVEWIQKLILFRHKEPKGMYYRYYISIFSKSKIEKKLDTYN